VKTGSPDTTDVYWRYWESGGRALTVEQLRSTSGYILGLQGVFSVLDAIVFPEHLAAFLTARVSVNVLLVSTLFWLRFEYPRFCQNAIVLAVGGEILLMVYMTGGPTSDYYVGLMLVCVGMPVLLPFRRREAFVITGLFLIGFALSPLIVPGEYDTVRFLTALAFIASGCAESVVSSGLLMKARIADFQQRAELEESRDRLAALDEAKARFSANVHHELRTPLTLILAPLDALRAGEFGELSATVDKTLRTMHINGQRLLKMINNLLDLAKVESRSFEIRRRPMELGKTLRDVVDGAGDLARRKGLALALEVPRAEGGAGALPINADPDALEKVVMNLVGNALKFTEPGGSITVSASPCGLVDGFDGVRVTVADSGIGLAPEQLARIFDRFSQVDSSATRKHEGTGIGLSLARELVELHGGRIWAESGGEGRGTSMIFELPVGALAAVTEAGEDALLEEVLCDEDGRGVKLGTSIQAVEADLALPPEPGDGARFAEMERSVQRWEGQRSASEGAERGDAPALLAADVPEVLVVEDNPDMRELLAFLVGREFRTRSARNGREALERVAESLPDLVLTDVMMPEMSGTELCRALKSDAATAGVPVVLVTSKAESEMKVEGLELGADDYVTKPFHPRELMARVRALVTQRCLRRELAGRNRDLESAMAELEQAQVKLVQSERLAAVGELAAGIAHEVNNPVNFALNAVRALKGSVAELQRLGECVASIDWADDAKRPAQLDALHRLEQELAVAELTETVGELSGIIGEGLKRTHSLVADLRDFAAPGARGEQTNVDVGKGLASTAQLLKHLLREAGAALELQVPAGLPQVQGDPGALNQVFLNLIKNATESSTSREGAIRVEASARDGNVIVVVRDHGSGMSEEVRRRLFEPFFTTKEGGRGTGLGLSICKQIIESHGGRLEVESVVGEGTTMTVVLPVGGAAAGR
jgi:signal transduction histidine kinase